MFIFPAAPGTYLLTRPSRAEGYATKTPVIGYVYVQGFIAFPLTVMQNNGLTRGRALLTPDGFVSDITLPLACADVAEWMKQTDAEAYWSKPETEEEKAAKAFGITEVKLTFDTPDEAGVLLESIQRNIIDANIARLVDAGDFSASGELSDNLRAKAIPDKPARTDREPRRFKTNSFWKYQNGPKHDPAWDCIWVILGGEIVPFENDPNYTKITGDEYRSLKKAGWTEADPRTLPAAEAAGDDEEDAGSNML